MRALAPEANGRWEDGRLPVLFEPGLGLVHNELVKATLEIINQMQADGVISHYAIGGAVGATFYLEPAATLDVDVFATLPMSGGLVTLTPIYAYLKARGGIEQDEYIVLDGWPVQFLPPANELEKEAVEKSVEIILEGVKTRVMTAEHLTAIALRTGRAKDQIRVLQFVEQNAVDREKLQGILERHGLIAQWKRFEQQHLTGH